MKEIEQYVDEITKELPDEEKEELREEMVGHLEEHLKELLIQGYSEEEAVRLVIDSFGDEVKLNQEFKRSFFPTYKLVRFAWSVVWTVAGLGLLSYFAMEYYHPEFDNGFPLDSLWMGMFYIGSLAGAGELMHHLLQEEIKWKWILNPWVFFMVPSLMISGLQTSMLFTQPEQYQDGLWLDLYAVAIGAMVYVSARQLFNGLFLGGHKAKRNVVK
ncbi:permease prefix domain 1-containing protein [Halobacillus halophilus]|uniref:permease prefix domain 1-containing protein n=1 Tax=Halobacillus halophilus TaxID=1570 RepID=UPI001CD695A9|nr:permease prefix domain 1-containing protein [Halobacillus halophilus]MCA1011696.1 permease prefix domain 1-containing protein [Halobacillus halophilus]